MLSYLKLAGLAAALAAVLGSYVFVYHLGGSSARAAAEAAHAAQLVAVVSTLEKQRDAAMTESVRRQGIIDEYDKRRGVPDPIVASLGHRVYIYATRAGCDPVPGVAAVAGGADATTTQSGQDARIERLSGLTQDVLDACADDASQMISMIDLATPMPRSSRPKK